MANVFAVLTSPSTVTVHGRVRNRWACLAGCPCPGRTRRNSVGRYRFEMLWACHPTAKGAREKLAEGRGVSVSK